LRGLNNHKIMRSTAKFTQRKLETGRNNPHRG
jgi:hypothetical protein